MSVDPTLPAPGTADTLAAPSGGGTADTLAAGATVASGIDATLPSGLGGGLGAPPELPELSPASYELREQLGAGGMGKVVVARDRRLGRLLAIKVSQSHDAGLRVRFTREAVLTARLQHPSIIPVHEAGLWSGEPFYAMKLVAGKSLAQLIARATTLDERLALIPNVIAVVDALAYAHAQRVIHRDLKPDNVIVGEYGETIVIDWGLAKELDREDDGMPSASPFRSGNADAAQTAVGAAMGTPPYMAPEQAAGERVDERADVYGLGAMLYHVLSGRAPYAGATADAVMTQVLDGPPVPLGERAAGVPKDLLAIVDRAMARAPADRYANAKLLADDLKRFARGQLVAARVYSRGELLRRFVVRHKTAIALATIAIAGLAVAATLYVRGEVREGRARDRRIAELVRADDTDLATARAQVAANDFAAAATTSAHQVERLRAAAPDLADRVSAREVDAKELARVAELYRHARAATFLTGDEDRTDDAIAELDAGLAAIGARAGDAFVATRWWEHIGARALDAAQQRDLAEEVYRQVLLLGLMEFKAGAVQVPPSIFVAKNAPAAVHFRAALTALGQISALETKLGVRPARVARIWQQMTVFFLRRTGRDDEAQVSGPLADAAANGAGADNAVDHTYLGAGEFLVWQARDSGLGMGLRTLFPDAFDYAHPLDAAERELRLAIALEPRQYWPQFMLGWTLREKGDFGGAELAFDACIALQPDNMLGYSQRAQALAARGERERAEADSQYTIAHAPEEAITWWSRGDLLRAEGLRAPAIEAYGKALALEDHLGTKFSRQGALDEVAEWARHVTPPPGAPPAKPGAPALLAYPDAATQALLAELALYGHANDHLDRAVALARGAMAAEYALPRATAVLGAALVARGSYADAAPVLADALAKDGKSYLAALAEARRLAATHAAAPIVADAVARARGLARTDGQRREATAP